MLFGLHILYNKSLVNISVFYKVTLIMKKSSSHCSDYTSYSFCGRLGSFENLHSSESGLCLYFTILYSIFRKWNLSILYPPLHSIFRKWNMSILYPPLPSLFRKGTLSILYPSLHSIFRKWNLPILYPPLHAIFRKWNMSILYRPL